MGDPAPRLGVLRPGDIVVVKQPGGRVAGAFQVGQVRSYQLTAGSMDKIRARFGKQIHAARRGG
jgi:hypothetical protein